MTIPKPVKIQTATELQRLEQIEEIFGLLKSIYLEQDINDWSPEIIESNFKQWRCTPEDNSGIVMLKTTMRIRAPLYSIMDNVLDFELRKTFDNLLFDFRVYEQSNDISYTRLSYAIKSPNLIVSDRDFYIQQLLRNDYPKKGKVSVVCKSLPDCEEYPSQKNRVRGDVKLIAYIATPSRCPDTDEEVVDFFSVSSVDIRGLVPKWVINIVTKYKIREWFTLYEKACIEYHKTQKGKASVHY